MPHLGAVWAVPPNQRLQLTPLRGPEIAAFLKTDFGSTAIAIYRCGATEAQAVGRASLERGIRKGSVGQRGACLGGWLVRARGTCRAWVQDASAHGTSRHAAHAAGDSRMP